MSFDSNIDFERASEPSDTQDLASEPSDIYDLASDYEGEAEASTKKRRKPKAKFQRLSKARQLANARERRRAQRIHDGFTNLARHVPQEPGEGDRLSRMDILQRAMDYIIHLEELLGIHREGPPKATDSQTSASASSPPISCCQSPAPCTDAVQTSTASRASEAESISPTTARFALTSNMCMTASGEVPVESSNSQQDGSQSCELDISAIDFDIDEDLSDIPASPEDIYNDLESIISGSTDPVGSPDGCNVHSAAQINSPSVEQCNGFVLPPFVHQLPYNQQSRHAEFVSHDQIPVHSVAAPLEALPPYTRAIATTPPPTVGRISTGAELSTNTARIMTTFASSAPIPPAFGKRPQNGMSVQPPAKRICPTAYPKERSSLPPSYCSLEFQPGLVYPNGTVSFGGPLPSVYSLRPSLCSV